MDREIIFEELLSMSKESGKFVLDFSLDPGRQNVVGGKSVINPVLQDGAAFAFMEKMGVGPVSKGTLFLDIPKHRSGFFFHVQRLKVETERSCVYSQPGPTSRSNTCGTGNDSGVFPGWQKALQSSRSRVKSIKFLYGTGIAGTMNKSVVVCCQKSSSRFRL
jgi:hypothetical protein